MGHELRADRGQARQTHVDHHRLARPRERGPIQVAAAVLEMARDEGAAVRVVAMRERNARIGRDAAARGDAGHHLEGNAFGGQRLQLFASAAEHERVAALEPHHARMLVREPGQQRIDVFLHQRVPAAFLAHVNPFRLRTNERKNVGPDQVVVHDDVRRSQQPRGAHGEQVGIARSRAHQVHGAAARAARGHHRCDVDE